MFLISSGLNCAQAGEKAEGHKEVQPPIDESEKTNAKGPASEGKATDKLAEKLSEKIAEKMDDLPKVETSDSGLNPSAPVETDPTLPTGSEPIPFDSALTTIISRSTSIAIQEARLNATRARNVPSRLIFLPSVLVDAREPLNGTESFLSSNRQVEMRAQLNVFKWGADYLGVKLANAEQASQEAALDATVLQVERDGVQSLIREIQRKKELVIHSQIVQIRTELLKIARERYDRGYLAIQEVEKLTVDLSNAKASYMNADLNEVDAQANLENLLGEIKVIPEWPWKVELEAMLESDLMNRSLSVNRRPDWLTASYQVEADASKLGQNWRLVLPKVDVSASYGTYQSFFGSFSGGTATLSIVYPIFEHLTTVSRAREQAYTLASSEAKLVQIQRNAQAEWQSSQKSIKIALESAVARDHTALLSRKLYQDNLKRFQIGRISSNDLAIDQNRMYDAQLLAIQGWGVAHSHFTRYCHSLGYRVKYCLSGKNKVLPVAPSS